MTTVPPPAVIGLDWGTSSLRATLFAADGTLLDRCARPWGIQHLPTGGYPAAFRGIVGEWLDGRTDLPVIAAGMVGSRTGWREVPYVASPAGLPDLAAGIVAFDGGCGTIHLVPGLVQQGPRPDVMRGEEVQIVGALATDPALEAGALFVLPGTHCKWAAVADGRIVRFTTYLTGELFALLRDHSIVGRPARDAGAVAAHAGGDEAFTRGVAAARDVGSAGIAGLLFSARSLFLTGDLAADHTLDYLSGLLVGEEIRSALAALDGIPCPPIVLLGDPALCRRYLRALEIHGVERTRSLDDTGPAGLWAVATTAGLVAR